MMYPERILIALFERYINRFYETIMTLQLTKRIQDHDSFITDKKR